MVLVLRASNAGRGQRLHWHSFVIVQVAVAAVASNTNHIGCRNPLFATHWAGKSDIIHLSEKPSVQFDLDLCPMYNGHEACCSNAFEGEQQGAFDKWAAHFKKMRQRIHDFQMEMERLKVSQGYVHVGFMEKALFDKAFQGFSPVFELWGTCFDTLLEFMAGVVCFACDPLWRGKSILDTNGLSVLALRLHESTYDELWRSCREFGMAADDLVVRIMDSALTKSVETEFEDLRPFTSRIGIAQYMVNNGLVPMGWTPEHELKVESEEPHVRQLRPKSRQEMKDAPGLTENGTDSGASYLYPIQEPHTRQLRQESRQEIKDTPGLTESGTDSGASYLYPIRDGRASGFRCAVFPRKALSPL